MMRRAMVMMMSACALSVAGCGDATTTTDAPAPTATATAGSSAAASSSVAASPSALQSDGQDDLRAAVRAYSDAFLNGKPAAAYELFSARCKQRISLDRFTTVVTAAKQLYGKALPFETYDAEVSGNFARVTYTFAVPALNQTKEPWVREDGRWKQDDC